jgi:HSP20 family molecular chaperone IbpA
MSKLPAGNRPQGFWPELADFFEGFPSWPRLLSPFGANIIRLEDEIKDGDYELRAELPGVDPEKEVDITVRDGVLTIKSERTAKKESSGRSEFSYGSFVRSVTLPPGADEDAITARYDKGILTVTVPIQQEAAEPQEKQIPVQAAK